MTRLNAVVAAAALTVSLFVIGCKENNQQPETVAQQPEAAPVHEPFPHDQIPEAQPAPAAQPPVAAANDSEPVAEEPITTISPEPAAAKPAARKTTAKPKEKYAPAKAGSRTYVVRKGDTLQEISKKFYGTTKSWRKIADANKSKVKDPNKLQIGTKLVIP